MIQVLALSSHEATFIEFSDWVSLETWGQEVYLLISKTGQGTGMGNTDTNFGKYHANGRKLRMISL
jgi:hypothetical protein